MEKHQKTPDGTSRGHGSRGNKREQAIAALLTSRTHRDAATAAGIGLRTLQKWLTEDSFAEAYARAKRELVDGTTTQLRGAGTLAVEVLKRIAASSQTAPASRVAAASSILRFMFTAIDIEDVLTRLERLERDRGGDEE